MSKQKKQPKRAARKPWQKTLLALLFIGAFMVAGKLEPDAMNGIGALAALVGIRALGII